MNVMAPERPPDTRMRRDKLGGERHRQAPTPVRIARRRRAIGAAKRLLPLAALLLLATVMLWPEVSRWLDHTRMRAGRLVQLASGLLTDPIYHGVDSRGRPYTITATTAREVSATRVDLTVPKADALLEGGRWMMIQGKRGVFMQHLGSLDLSGDVLLYRDDGTTMATDSATLDTKAGVASGADRVHVEGPFGTLDAQGFTFTDRGTAIQFAGPGRLILNGHH